MPELPSDSLALLSYLTPGLLAAWVWHGLTSGVKPGQFERTVQALIFSYAVQVLMPPVRWLLTRPAPLPWLEGTWHDHHAGLLSAALGVLLGMGAAAVSNFDRLHALIRVTGLSKRASYATEWYGVFTRTEEWVVLHLKDERRLYGWPTEWPNDPSSGHFFITQPCWLAGDGREVDLPTVHGILIAASDVRWIEFTAAQDVDTSEHDTKEGP